MIRNSSFSKIPFDLLKLLKKEKIESRIVGGAVRNLLINKIPNDYDIAVSCEIDSLINILNKNNLAYYEVGKQFGTIVVLFKGKNYEITQLRKEEGEQGRWPSKVLFTNSWEEDASRRDFTVNAMFLDYDLNLYDYNKGLLDLKEGKLKFVGNFRKRIREDRLRVLRLVRFSFSLWCSSLNYKWMKKNINYSLARISSERKIEELRKIFDLLYIDFSIKKIKKMGKTNILNKSIGLQTNPIICVNKIKWKVQYLHLIIKKFPNYKSFIFLSFLFIPSSINKIKNIKGWKSFEKKAFTQFLKIDFFQNSFSLYNKAFLENKNKEWIIFAIIKLLLKSSYENNQFNYLFRILWVLSNYNGNVRPKYKGWSTEEIIKFNKKWLKRIKKKI